MKVLFVWEKLVGLVLKWAYPGHFLLIFVRFKQNFTKNYRFQRDLNLDRRIEGEHADH